MIYFYIWVLLFALKDCANKIIGQVIRSKEPVHDPFLVSDINPINWIYNHGNFKLPKRINMTKYVFFAAFKDAMKILY